MPTVVIKPGATVFVTGVNGLIGSYVVDVLLDRGYNVRGAVRGAEKNKWLKEYFDKKYEGKDVGLELVEVRDMIVEGCYDEHVEGVEGFIHVASPVGGITDLEQALNLGRSAAMNALTACAKTASVKRFVNTASSFSATFPKPHAEKDFIIDESTYNDAALEEAKVNETPMKGLYVYGAMKSETEKAMWQWVKDKKPNFSFNSILPNANFGPLLIPEHQGYPSTVAWIHAAFTGESFGYLTQAIESQWFISPRDTALLHVSALIHAEVDGERLFGYAERWNWDKVLAILRKHYPERKFPEDIGGLKDDKVVPPTKRAEEVLKWIKGSGWDGLEESIVAMTEKW